MNFRQIFTFNIQMPRILHRPERKQNIRRFIFALFARYDKMIFAALFDFRYRFFPLNVQVIFQHKPRVIRQQFFPRRLLPRRKKRVRLQLQFVNGGKNRQPDRILINRIADEIFLQYEIIQIRFLRFKRGGNSRWSRADNY